MPAEENHKFLLFRLLPLLLLSLLLFILLFIYSILLFLSTINRSLLITTSDPTYRLFTLGFA